MGINIQKFSSWHGGKLVGLSYLEKQVDTVYAFFKSSNGGKQRAVVDVAYNFFISYTHKEMQPYGP